MNMLHVERAPVRSAGTAAPPMVERIHGARVVAVALACALGVLLQAYVGYRGRESGNPSALVQKRHTGALCPHAVQTLAIVSRYPFDLTMDRSTGATKFNEAYSAFSSEVLTEPDIRSYYSQRGVCKPI